MYCSHCGQEQVSDKTRYCTRCGSLVIGIFSARRTDLIKGILLIVTGVMILPLLQGIVEGFTGKSFGQAISSATLLTALELIVFFWGVYRVLSVLKKEKEIRRKEKQHPSLTDSSDAALQEAPNKSVVKLGRRSQETREITQPSSVTEDTTKVLDEQHGE